MTELTTDTRQPAPSIRTAPKLLPLYTLVAASAAALLIWTIAVPVMGLALEVRAGAAIQVVDAVSVAVSPVIAGLVAWGLRALLARFLRRGTLLWLVLGWGILALSLVGPLTLSLTFGSLVVLTAMHLVVGAILILGLGGTRR